MKVFPPLLLFVTTLVVVVLAVEPTTPTIITTLQSDLLACASTLPDSRLELSTYSLSLAFQSFITQDSIPAVASEVANSAAGFYRRSAPSPSDVAYAAGLPGNETADTITILQTAIADCKAANVSGRLPTIDIPPGAHIVSNSELGMLTVAGDNKPYFLFGYNEYPDPLCTTCNSTRLSRVRAHVSEVNLTPKYLVPTINTSDVRELTAAVNNLTGPNLYGTVVAFFNNGREASSASASHGAMPDWANQLYPNLSTNIGRTQFFSYDIDNPGAKVVWDKALAAAVPVMSNAGVFRYSLANEPGFSVSNSTFTLAKYVTWLQQRYDSVGALNTAWRTKFSSWSDPSIVNYMQVLWHSTTAQRFDWSTFNALRGSEWFEWVFQRIRLYAGHQASEIQCQIKASNGQSPVASQDPHNGLGRLRLSTSLGINGCDTRSQVGPKSHISFPANPMVYSFDWASMLGAYAWMRSASPHNPVVDAEWHPFSTTRFRDLHIPAAYSRTLMLLAYASGVSSLQTWAWLRNADTGRPTMPKELFGADFYASLGTQPIVMDACIRTNWEANALVTQMMTLLAARKSVFVLESLPASMAEDSTTQNMAAAYSLAAQLPGAGAGFVFDGRLSAGQTDAGTQCLAGEAGPCTVVLPCSSRASNATVSAFHHAATSLTDVVKLVRVCNASTVESTFSFDDMNHPRDPSTLSWLSSIPLVSLDSTHLADAGALATLTSAVKPSIAAQTSIVCVDGNSKAWPVFGLWCQTSGGVVLMANLLQTALTIGLSTNTSTPIDQATIPFTKATIKLPITLPPMESVLLEV